MRGWVLELSLIIGCVAEANWVVQHFRFLVLKQEFADLAILLNVLFDQLVDWDVEHVVFDRDVREHSVNI